ncbi:hypothetical protein ES319_A05G237700v1 [Gossypium barbadense]|uniref:Uncharacterized protein n=2 Tax=Gossypium TaxID=3633 RepID=A0A5J5VS73_GOSBA|nr:hypothetical protein ES319_A05G237700v1 [Gossypium barbadense]TYH18109.1 hypothetical protein ES288_A05G243500v1 [Gossypium darwinii]
MGFLNHAAKQLILSKGHKLSKYTSTLRVDGAQPTSKIIDAGSMEEQRCGDSTHQLWRSIQHLASSGFLVLLFVYRICSFILFFFVNSLDFLLIIPPSSSSSSSSPIYE